MSTAQWRHILSGSKPFTKSGNSAFLAPYLALLSTFNDFTHLSMKKSPGVLSGCMTQPSNHRHSHYFGEVPEHLNVTLNLLPAAPARAVDR